MDSEMAPPDDPAPSTSATPALDTPNEATTNTTHPSNQNQPINTNATTTNINITNANTTNINTTNSTATESNTQQAATVRQQNDRNERTTQQHPRNARQTNNNTTTPPDEEIIFDIPDLETAKKSSAEAYKTHIHQLHAKLMGGEATDYVETKIPLPRSLQGLRTGQVMTRLLALNTAIETTAWTEVMADVVGNNLILGTVTAGGKEKINNLIELKIESGRTVSVPRASKPNNMYYVECLLPYERDLHVEFMAAFLKNFPSAQHISMPGKKAFGTTRRIRIYFPSSTAPREVFTSNDANTPIREIILPCGSAAQVIHKWQRLNLVRPPHLLNRWAQNTTHRSPTALNTGATYNTNTTNPPISYAQAAANNLATRHTELHNQPTPSQHAPPTTSNQLQRRPGEVPHGPPHHPPRSQQPQQPPLNSSNNNPTNATPPDWDDNEPFPPSTSGHPTSNNETTIQQTNPTNTQNTSLATSTHTANKTTERQDTVMHETDMQPALNLTPTPTHIPSNRQQHHREQAPTSTDATTTATQTNGTAMHPRPNTIQPQSTTTQPERAINTTNTEQINKETDPPTSATRQTKINTTHPTPSRSGENLSQWHQVKRARTRQSTASQREYAQAQPTAHIRKSGSQNKGQQTGNKFTPLDFEVHPSYEDDAVAPITVKIPSSSRRNTRRKYKTTRKAWTKNVTDAASHPQQVRHPAQTLQHLSPHQTQVLLRSKDDNAQTLKAKLLNQIALIRAARSNTTDQRLHMDVLKDEDFLQQINRRLKDCPDAQQCIDSTPADIPLRAILEQDETRLRGARCFAHMDLITRATLPAIYDVWPERPTWHGLPLTWLPAQDGELPCLQDSALAALADCPTLQLVWRHIMKEAPDIESVISTAANQWRLFKTAKATHRVDNAPQPPSN